MSTRCLVVSNCQTVGLARSLSLICPGLEVVGIDVWQFVRECSAERMRSEYDILVTLPEDQLAGRVDTSGWKRVVRVPGFVFRGLHPDMTYVKHRGEILQGPMGDYHSLIVLASFLKGVPVGKVPGLFREEVYRHAGFFSIWDEEKRVLLERFDAHGLDLRNMFIRWMRGEIFLYSFNHPKIRVLVDIATLVAEKLDTGRIRASIPFPPDNLATAPVWPVYPEIAEHYGFAGGGYLFKPPGIYRLMDLERFVDTSYEVYRGCDRDSLETGHSLFPRVTEAVEVLA